jgi:hypothetical protein
MEPSPPWEAPSFSAAQQFPKNVWEVHYNVHKSPPVVPIVSHSSEIAILVYLCRHENNNNMVTVRNILR